MCYCCVQAVFVEPPTQINKLLKFHASHFPVLLLYLLASGHYKGRCGGAEDAISNDKVRKEAKKLAQMLRGAPIVVVHTGAGLSTAAGERGDGGVGGHTIWGCILCIMLNLGRTAVGVHIIMRPTRVNTSPCGYTPNGVAV